MRDLTIFLRTTYKWPFVPYSYFCDFMINYCKKGKKEIEINLIERDEEK